MNIVKRVKAPTPRVFRTLRTAGLVLVAVSTAVMTAPVALPALIVTVAGYLTVAGSILSAVSQITVEGD